METPVTTPATQSPEPATFTPTADNAPKGMVFCKECKCHVKKGKALPNLDGEFICKTACTKPTATPAKAKAATAKAATATPGKNAKVAKTGIITAIAPNPKKKNTLSWTAFSLYKEGMTVADYCAIMAKTDTGAITGHSEINHDLAKGYISIMTPEQYAAMEAEAMAA
jgi:hypothetical protein